MTWIHLFTRDLRIVDNNALEALSHKTVLPVFIMTPEQTTSKNALLNERSIGFMCDSLRDLHAETDGSLQCFRGTVPAVLQRVLRAVPDVEGISMIKDYTPYAKEREETVRKLALAHKLEFSSTDDIYLHAPGVVLNASKKPYQKFTPFYEASRKLSPAKPNRAAPVRWMRQRVPGSISIPSQSDGRGGRKRGLKILASFDCTNYARDRDMLSKETSLLSAHNHFGTVSIREVYHAMPCAEFRRQLYWRDFYGQIVAFFPVLYGVSPYDFMKTPGRGWSTDRAAFNRWAQARTGVPLVDAAMRQLLETGYMHNRARLVAASYLVKDLKIHWRWGERFFAKQLVDYDFSQNFGNWCWVSSVLPFSMPPFRRFDPATQAKRYDPDGQYVVKTF